MVVVREEDAQSPRTFNNPEDAARFAFELANAADDDKERCRSRCSLVLTGSERFFVRGEQEELIVAAVGPQGNVALMFDEDEAGWKGREDALSRLSGRVYVKVIGLGEEGQQPDSLSDEDLTRVIPGL